MTFLLLASCGSLICGTGTVERDGVCVAVSSRDGTTDGGATTDGGSPDGGGSDGGGSDGGGSDGGGSDGGSDDSGSDDSGSPAPVVPLRVYLLAGQSNMAGIGQVTGLPPSQRTAQPDVELYWSGLPGWRALEPSSPYSSGSARYTGPEVSFGRALADARPDARILLVKHAVGGTDLAQYWYPGESRDDHAQGEGYRTWLATVEAALADLDARGEVWEVAGMAWMQGESDATNEDWANRYQENLAHLVARVRSDLAQPALPFVLGLIDCTDVCAWRETVRGAQQAVAEADPRIFTIETEDLGLYPADHWHYQGLGVRVMGERFADALLDREPSTVPEPAVRMTGAWSWSYRGDYMVGWRFTLSAPIVITDVGVFDLNGDGLAHTADVAIWETDSQTLLAQDTVPAADEADTTLLDGFRLVGVEPVLLEPGDYVVANQAFDTDWDWYVYDAEIETGADLSWVEGRHGEGSAVVFPTTSVAGSTDQATWFGAGFRYRPLEDEAIKSTPPG